MFQPTLFTSPPGSSLIRFTEYEQFAKTLMRHRHWDMEFGSRFLQDAQYTEASLLQHFYKHKRQYYTNLHTSIATSRRRIIVWRCQGTILLTTHWWKRVTSAPPQTPQSQSHGGSVAGPLEKNGLTLYISRMLTVPQLSQGKGHVHEGNHSLGSWSFGIPRRITIFSFLLCADALVAWRQSSLLHRQVTGN